VTRKLLASIHDVSPRTEVAVDVLLNALARHVGQRLAMLVVPDHWNEAPIAGNRAFQARLRGWADAGIEMFLHGWCHCDDRQATLAARHMTAGEGEFSSLDAAEAAARIARGRAVVEDAIGRPVAGFIAPAWLYSPGTHAALAAHRLPLAEDHMKLWQPGGATLARGPVITWASRSRLRIASSLAVAALGRQVLALLPVVRVAVHPGDVGVPAIMASIDATLARLVTSHTPSRYADLLPQSPGR
jgi:predicted deacetylase